MRVIARYLALLILLVGVSAQAFASQVEINGVRISSNPEYTRVVLDASAPIKHSLFTLSGPDRVVVDLKNAKMQTSVSNELLKKSKVLDKVRSAAKNATDLRLVLDLNDRVRPKSFMLPPKKGSGHRLVIDLYDSNVKTSPTTAKKATKAGKLRDVVIAIDAGHGGKDPGALGHKGLKEKDVTLKLARKLAKRINDTQGMRAVLVRDDDYFIPLRNRIIKARNHKADLFISIHADAFTSKNASGSSVYALSLNGASSEAAKWLADRENAADLVGGITLDDKDDLLASVLLDLSQTATIQSSLEVGDYILGQLGKIKKLHKKQVQQAGFLVLKSPDIPSVLIETAFITNPGEAKSLRSAQHRDKLTRAIVRGVRRYFAKKAPPGTWLAEFGNRNVVASVERQH